MTMTDYTLIAAAAATMLLVAACWWRRCSRQTRIFAQENAWFLGSLWFVQYVWYAITIDRPFQITTLGAFAALTVWLAALLPIVIRRIRCRSGAVAKTHADTAAPPEPAPEPMPGAPSPRDRRPCCTAKRGRTPQDRQHPRSGRRRAAGRTRNESRKRRPTAAARRANRSLNG